MVPLLDYPEVVKHYEHFFKDIFSDSAMTQFKRYISGLIVSENKTVEGINRLIIFENRDQSSLNRLLNKSPFSEEKLNQKRLDLLASLEGTRFKPKGVLSIDDTLLEHYGKHFKGIAKLYDSSKGCHVWAHHLVGLHYSDDQTDYPVEFELWKPADLEKIEEGLPELGIPIKESKLELKKTNEAKWRQYLIRLWRRHQNKDGVTDLYESKFHIAKRLLSKWKESNPRMKLPIVFDKWYTAAPFCRFIDKELKLPYVGTLCADDKVIVNGQEETIKDFSQRLKKEHFDNLSEEKKPVFRKITISYKGKKERYYSFCCTIKVKNFGKQRLVINYREEELKGEPYALISNCLKWQSAGITRIRRHRWPIEVYHEEGKAEGLDQYQVRDIEAICRHISFVAVVYSLLRAIPHDQDLLKKLQNQLKVEIEGSNSHWCRVAKAQSLWSLASFISAGLVKGQTLESLMAPILAAVCY